MCILLIFVCIPAYAVPLLSLGPAVVGASNVTFPVILTNTAGTPVTGITTDIVFSSDTFAVIMNGSNLISATAGAAAIAAGKQIYQSSSSTGVLHIYIIDLAGKTAIPDGVVAQVSFSIVPSASQGNYTFKNVPSATDTLGNNIAIAGANTTVAIAALPVITWYHKGDGSLFTQTTNGLAVSGGSMVWKETNPAWSIVGGGDFNGDGVKDYVWYNSTTGQVFIMLMKNSTEILSGRIVHTEPDTAWRIVATGDINGNHITDLIWQNRQTGDVYVMLINNAVEGPGAFIHTEPDTSWKIIAAVDLNASGTTNLIWWHTVTGQVAIMTTNGFNPVNKQIIYQEANTNWRIVAAGDTNGDGSTGLIWRNRITGQVSALNYNSNSVTGWRQIATEPDPAWEIISLGNYNCDSAPELLWWNGSTGQMGVMPVNGTTPATRTTIFQESNTTWRPQGTEQWNDQTYGQGTTTAHSNATALTWGNMTTGQTYGMTILNNAVTGGATINTEPDLNWSVIGQGDFNGDGIKDLLWNNKTTGQLYLMLMKSGAEQKNGTLLYQEQNTQWNVVATGDINGDGTSDLIWWNKTTGQVYAQTIVNGKITNGSIIYTEPDTRWKIVGTGDVNGNGKTDLIWWNSSSGQIAIGITNALSQSYAQIIYTEPDTDWRIAGVGDINGDGKTDLIWHNKTTGQVSGMLLNETSIIGLGLIYTQPDLNWYIASVGDYNNDGKADLLWQNSATGQVLLMELNGLTVSNNTMLFTEPNTTWHIQGETEWRDNVYGKGETTTR